MLKITRKIKFNLLILKNLKKTRRRDRQKNSISAGLVANAKKHKNTVSSEVELNSDSKSEMLSEVEDMDDNSALEMAPPVR